jgi:ubiquinone/menaquinone biosynthesis C-methylase UbiE
MCKNRRILAKQGNIALLFEAEFEFTPERSCLTLPLLRLNEENCRMDIIRVPTRKEDIAKFYGRVSKWHGLYKLQTAFSKGEQSVKDRALETAAIKEGDVVLEVAIGAGDVIEKIAGRVGEKGKVYGVDVAKGYIEFTQKRLAELNLRDNVHLQIADAKGLPFEDNKFDAIINCFMMDLIDTPEIPKVLSEFKRVVRTHGKVVIATMAIPEGKQSLLSKIMSRSYLFFIKHVYGKWGCRPILTEPFMKKVGFSNIQREYIGSFMWFPKEIVWAEKT